MNKDAHERLQLNIPNLKTDNVLTSKVEQLIAYLNKFDSFAIAASGGVDSMVLAYVANRFSDANVTIVHAYSPAVPHQAYERVKQHAKRFKWSLKVLDAGEFNDSNYLQNPVNRCYFCKSNLYSRIIKECKGTVFSGTNLDDLSDYRPGLKAAKEQHVMHPYVEAGIDKATIYQIAAHYQLDELHALPAQPCLASRVETGIKISPDDLDFINQVETYTRSELPSAKDVRCRITHQGTYLEIDKTMGQPLSNKISQTIGKMCAETGRVFSGIRTYQKGSAFVTGVIHG